MTADTAWRTELDARLAPFLAQLRRSEQHRWAPLHVRGLPGSGESESVEPIAGRVAPGEVQPLRRLVSSSPWWIARLEAVPAAEADELVGGPNAVLVIDDTETCPSKASASSASPGDTVAHWVSADDHLRL